MTDIPIIFSAPMVRALLDGRKTMTRRLAWQTSRAKRQGFSHAVIYDVAPSPWQQLKPGARLWVREKALYWINNTGPDVNKPSKVAAFASDGYELEEGERWTPSIHMPRWASRITLVVTATKIERLQDISEADAMAEGVERSAAGTQQRNVGQVTVYTFRTGFVRVWGDLHGTDSWLSNPQVVALTFRVIKQNIDTLEAA